LHRGWRGAFVQSEDTVSVMDRLLLDADYGARRTQIMHTQSDNEVVIETLQNVDDILDITKQQYNDSAGERFGTRAQVARIPAVVWGDLVRSGIAFDPVAFKKWLNDFDNRVWRTRPGRV